MYDLFISGIPENQPVGELFIKYYIVGNKQNLNECRAYAVIVKWKKEDSDKINFSFKFVCVSLWILVDINLNVFYIFEKH